MSTTKEQFTIKGIHGDSTMNRATYEDYQRALKSRRDEGRYTLEEAALFVCEQTGGHAKEILKMLMDGARAGTLRIYNPGIRYPRSKEDAQKVWHAIEEAYWNDLNEWLEKNAPRLRLDCEFPKPDAPAANNDAPKNEEPPCITAGMVTITRLAITAAWQIEREIGRIATAKEVIKLLQDWVTSKRYEDLIEIIPRGVKWMTSAPDEKPYDINACRATLKEWHKNRKTASLDRA